MDMRTPVCTTNNIKHIGDRYDLRDLQSLIISVAISLADMASTIKSFFFKFSQSRDTLAPSMKIFVQHRKPKSSMDKASIQS